MSAPTTRRRQLRTLVAGTAVAAFLSGGAISEALRPQIPVERISVPPELEDLPEGKFCWVLPLGVPIRPPEVVEPEVLVEERFDNANLTGRGWYDNVNLVVENGALRYHFAAGASFPDSGGGTRILFEPQREVVLTYRVKYALGWVGSGQAFHPHEFYFLTTADGRYAGLARSHLTIYIEQNAGRPMLLLQDGLNIGAGAVAGCDPLPLAPAGYPSGDCYTSGGNRMNGRTWRAAVSPLTPGDWHTVEARVRLNTAGQADGVLSVSVDGTRVLHADNVIMRGARNGEALLNQLILGPYVSRSPVDQTFYIDDLVVTAGAP